MAAYTVKHRDEFEAMEGSGEATWHLARKALGTSCFGFNLVEIGPGVALQLLQVDFDHNIRVTRARLAPGVRLRTHIHTGHVFAWTVAGTWHYLEYPESSRANAYLYEPAGSQHTLHVPDDSTEPADVIFIVHGSNLELGATGEFEGATSAADIAPSAA